MSKYYVIKTDSCREKYYAGYHRCEEGYFIGECCIPDKFGKPKTWKTRQGAEKALEKFKNDKEYQYLTDGAVKYWGVEEIVNE